MQYARLMSLFMKRFGERFQRTLGLNSKYICEHIELLSLAAQVTGVSCRTAEQVSGVIRHAFTQGFSDFSVE